MPHLCLNEKLNSSRLKPGTAQLSDRCRLLAVIFLVFLLYIGVRLVKDKFKRENQGTV